MYKVMVTAELQPWNLAESLDWDYERIVEFIRELDVEIGDSVFTDQLIAKLKEGQE